MRKPGVQLAAILVVAAVVRLLALYHGANVVAPLGDEHYYLEQGTSIAEGEGHPGSFRPPLYSFLIGAVFAAVGRDLLVLRIVQIVVSLVAVGLIHEICRERFGTAAAMGSGIVCAVSPRLAHYSHFLWAETLFITFFAMFLWWLHRFDRRGRTLSLVLAAVALALSALTKEIVIFYVPLLLPWFAFRLEWDWTRAGRQAAVFLGCFVLVLVPWMVRNYIVNDAFVGLSTCRWFPIATGNLRAEDTVNGTKKRVEFLRQWRSLGDEVEKEELSKSVALESIRSQLPWWPLRKLRLNIPRLLSPESQELRFIREGLYPPTLGRAARRVYVITSLSGHLLLMSLGLAAFWFVRGDALKWPLLAMIGYSVFVYVVANATARFLVVLLPLFYVYAGPLLARAQIGRQGWRRAAAVSTVVLFVAIVLSHVPEALGAVWNGPEGP